MDKVNFLLVSSDGNAENRCRDVCKSNGYSFSIVSNSVSINQFADVILLTTENYSSESDLTQNILQIKQLCPESFLLVSISAQLHLSIPQHLKKAGADCVFLDLDLYTSSKLEFVAFQKIETSHIALKVDDLRVDSSIDCFLYHRIPTHRKLIPVLWPNEMLTNYKMERIRTSKDIYILRKDLPTFQKYLGELQTSSVITGRIQFLHLMTCYYDLLLYFCDHSHASSFKKGEDLLNYCIFTAHRLADSLRTVHSIWPILDLSMAGNYGSVERSPIIATYAALLGIQSKMGNPANTILAALLADLGMLFLSPKLAHKIQHGFDLRHLNKLENDEYKKHPSMSLVAALSRKIKIPEPIKQIILRTHERVDQTGFPYMPHPEIIPLESMLIQFSEITLEEKLNASSKAPLLLPEKPVHANIFSVFFLDELQKYLSLAN